MSNIIVRMLAPEEYYLLEEFCASEDIACPSSTFSYAVVAIDMDTEKVVGVVAAQMQVHTEPMWIKKEYQDGQLWKRLSDELEGYLDMRSLQAGGAKIAVWCQPTNAAAERICRMRGFEKSDKPLYNKVYDGSGLLKALQEFKEADYGGSDSSGNRSG